MPDRRVPAALAAVVATLTVVALAIVVVVATGAYDVAATSEHSRATRWLLNTAMERSVAVRASELDVPLPSDSAALEHGLVHFQAMCVVCHGAPGIARGEFGQGMTPVPPRLERAADGWSDAELVWIIEHGVKLAGMPAFGPTHGEEEIRQIAAVVRRLPQLDSAAYARWIDAAGLGASSAGHGHSAAGSASARTAPAAGSGNVHIHSDGSAHTH